MRPSGRHACSVVISCIFVARDRSRRLPPGRQPPAPPSMATLKRSGRDRAYSPAEPCDADDQQNAAQGGQAMHEDHAVVATEAGPNLPVTQRPTPAAIFSVRMLDIGARIGDQIDRDHA